MTTTEMIEFHNLKWKLFGKDKFVVLNEQSPDVQRYNELYIKFVEFHKRHLAINEEYERNEKRNLDWKSEVGDYLRERME